MSSRIEDDPLPKAEPDKPSSIAWLVRRSLICPPIVPPALHDFTVLAESRRSTRIIKPASLREIVNVIGFATRPYFFREDDPYERSLRPNLSAGALHPIEILVVGRSVSSRVMHYKSRGHCLESLRVVYPDEIKRLIRRSAEMLPHAYGTILVFLGDLSCVSAVYKNPTSLLWRDAGALLQTLALTTAAYRLAFCPLGILGHEMIQALGLTKSNVIAAGVALIGRSVE